MPLSLKNKKYPSYKKKSKKKKLGSQKLPRQIMRGGAHPEDVFQSLQRLSIYNDEYTYPELIFQDNVALYNELIEYGKYHLTKFAIDTYAHPRNLLLCIFLNRFELFKLLYNSYYKDKFIKQSGPMHLENTVYVGIGYNYPHLMNLAGYFPNVNTEKRVFDFSETFNALINLSKTDLIWTKLFTNTNTGNLNLFWIFIIALGRVDILSAVLVDIIDKEKFRENIMTRTEVVFVPDSADDGDEMVKLLKSEFHFEDHEIKRFVLPDTLHASSINKKLEESQIIYAE